MKTIKISNNFKSILKLIIYLLTSYSYILCDEALDSLTAPIVREGKHLYQLETASWDGTDIFLENYTEKSKIGGYFSYIENNTTRCVFISKEDKPKVIGTIYFDSTLSKKSSILSLEERNLSSKESEIWDLRKAAFSVLNSDTSITRYKETNLNVIPVIKNNLKKVYILTGTTKNNLIILGNDYLLSFDKDNRLISREKLHSNIIMLDASSKNNVKMTNGFHTHSPETGDFITATDICTLMLYSKLYSLESHYVISQKYVSIWDSKSNKLMVITKEVWDKFYKK